MSPSVPWMRIDSGRGRVARQGLSAQQDPVFAGAKLQDPDLDRPSNGENGVGASDAVIGDHDVAHGSVDFPFADPLLFQPPPQAGGAFPLVLPNDPPPLCYA